MEIHYYCENLGIQMFDNMVRSLLELCIESGREPKFWTDGEKILSKDRNALYGIADLIDQLADYPVCSGGYYDPDEDAQFKTCDEYTGFYYIQLAE